MKHYGEYKNLFSKLYEESQIQLDAKMSEHIYFKVGGPVGHTFNSKQYTTGKRNYYYL